MKIILKPKQAENLLELNNNLLLTNYLTDEQREDVQELIKAINECMDN